MKKIYQVKRPFLILISFLSLAFSCQHGPEYKSSVTDRISLSQKGMDVPVPEQLVEQLESRYVPEIIYKSVENFKQATNTTRIPRTPMAIKVYLQEKTSGILLGKNLEISFPAGGGEIDLKNFLADKNGSFYFAVEAESKGDSPVYVYFLSRSRKRKIGTDIVGGGCDSFADLSHFFNGKMKEDGLLVNTSQARHLGVLGGTFFFATSAEGKFYVSQLTIKDTRFNSIACE